jgi:2-amino-4-hydroxy-6-hydroxymethyldihydropteridine diphosphokinase
VNSVFLGLGANLPGNWGAPSATLGRACEELQSHGLRIERRSAVYATVPLGPGRQAPYLNAVVLAQADCAPAELLRIVKHIERQAGRRFGPVWGARCLDIDVLDYGSRKLGWPPGRRARGQLILPHPEIAQRAFVLVPLLEIEPHWRHPALGVAGRTLLARLGRRGRLGVRRRLDFAVSGCDKRP